MLVLCGLQFTHILNVSPRVGSKLMNASDISFYLLQSSSVPISLYLCVPDVKRGQNLVAEARAMRSRASRPRPRPRPKLKLCRYFVLDVLLFLFIIIIIIIIIINFF